MFEFEDRKQDGWLVLIAGWGFDYRIFSTLVLPYNYIFSSYEGADNFEAGLKKLLAAKGIKKVSVLGWSQGAFSAADFAAKNLEQINELILVGLRRKYEKQKLEEIRQLIARNRAAYMRSFYRQCFCAQERDYYLRFKNTLLKSYLDEMTSEQLIAGLDRLGRLRIGAEGLKSLKDVKIVHGSSDAVASVNEAIDLAGELPCSRLFIFEDTGHLPFLREDFRKRLYD